MINNKISLKLPFSEHLAQENVTKRLINALTDTRKVERFKTALIAMYASGSLRSCTNDSIINAGLEALALGLNPSSKLGLVWFVPYSNKATLILGYKGMIQLIVQSGLYKSAVCVSVKKSEFEYWDPFNEILKVNAITDPDKRDEDETVGYYCMIKCLNGFEKSLYWSKKQVKEHASNYSPGYERSNFWRQHFDAMAQKTVLRQMIMRWGVKNDVLENAILTDKVNTEAVWGDEVVIPGDVITIRKNFREEIKDDKTK
jgi:recombination protein RecT